MFVRRSGVSFGFVETMFMFCFAKSRKRILAKGDCTGRENDFRKFGPYKYVANL